MRGQPTLTRALDAIIDEEVFVLLPDTFPAEWIPLSEGAQRLMRAAQGSLGAPLQGPISSEGSLLAPTRIPVDQSELASSQNEPRTGTEQGTWGAHPALQAAQHARDEEDLLSEIEFEIDRELEVELRARPRVSGRRLAIAGGVIIPVVLPYILIVGWPYYSLPIAERVFHPFHSVLRSSGTVGLPLGVIALVTLCSNLAYLVRKKLVRRLGVKSLPGWLRFHIVTGLLGPLIAFFHAGFVPTSAMGLFSMLSMGIVIVSGVVGRYLLAYIPKNTSSSDVALDDVRRRLVIYKRKLMSLGVRTAFLDIEPRAARKREPGLITSMIRVALGDRAARRDMRKLRGAIELRPAGVTTAQMQFLVTRLCRERQWLIRSQEMRRFIVAWRFFHRWFAIVLFMAIAFHVWVALRFGGLLR